MKQLLGELCYMYTNQIFLQNEPAHMKNGTYHIGEQQELIRVYTSWQSHHSLRCSLT